MKKLIVASALLAALCVPVLAGGPGQGNQGGNGQGNNGNGGNGNGGNQVSAVPGPLVGAGLPFIAVGYGAYWLIRRRRKSTTPSA
jgi:hypothetical protein